MEALDLNGAPILQVATDSRNCGPQSLFVALRGENADGHHFVPEAAARGATHALVEMTYEPPHSIPHCQLLRVPEPLLALQEIAAKYRKERSAQVVAITGSRGKTLLKELLRQLLEPYRSVAASPDSFNSQLGVALSLLQIENHHEIALIEAGISRTGEMARLVRMIQPDAAILTNLGSAHLTSLGGSEAQAREKGILLEAAKRWTLRPDDDSWITVVSNDYTSRLVYRVRFPDGHTVEAELREGLGFGLELIQLALKAAWNLGLTSQQLGERLPHLHLQPLDSYITVADGITLVAAPEAKSQLSQEKILRRLPSPARGGRVVRSVDEAKSGDVVLTLGKRLEEMQPCVPHSQLSLRLSAIEANLEQLRLRHPQTRMMAMVKAAGYGTDGALLAKAVARWGIDIVGVAHVHEAMALRRAGVTQSIFVIYVRPSEATLCAAEGFEVAVYDRAQIDALAATKRPVRCHLHVDTGMTRLGCRPEAALELALHIQKCPPLILEGLMTHFAASEEPAADQFTYGQAQKLEQVHQQLLAAGLQPRWVHAANSAGAARLNLPFCNMARVGLGLLGMADWGEPAAALTSSLAAIHHCRQGDTISYGRTYTVKRPEERIGVIPLGYFDGIHRHYGGRAHVMVRGQPAPLVGTICMDFTMVDLTHIPEAQVGDRVVLFGTDINGQSASPTALALQGQTSVYELLACLGPRIQRVFIDDL